MQTNRKNLTLFTYLILFLGSVIALVALSYFPDYRVIIGLTIIVHVAACLFFLNYQGRLEKKLTDKTPAENKEKDEKAPEVKKVEWIENKNPLREAEYERTERFKDAERRIISERVRAETAESYIRELQEYVAEQDKTNQSLKEGKEKFRHAAFHDALTDLPNRSLFIETLKFMLEKHKQIPNYNFAVLSLDLNRFKTINDSLGHSTGDQLILSVAKRLTESIREGDLVARFGGDEFGIILNDISNLEEADSFARRIRNKISTPFDIGGRQVFSSVSVGIAFGNSSYEEAQDVLRDADIAMYHAKKDEEDIKVFDDGMHARALSLLELETDLRHAIERKELCAYFQPIIGLDSMKLVGFEALIRWNHPLKGLIPPSEFIPVSEDTNLIVPITLWMLHHSCLQMVKWQRQSPLNRTLFLSVNLSGKHFAQKDLVSQVRNILIDTGVEASSLKLEITESAVMENAEMVIPMLRDLKALGVQLSIDDFGTGYSSLSYLHRFPIDTLKIDRSFVSAMEEGTENGEIVRTIIALAKTLGMDVVAEGIETVHQLHQLRILNCEYGQGYLFSKPVSGKEADLLLAEKAAWQNLLPVQETHPIETGIELSQWGRMN